MLVFHVGMVFLHVGEKLWVDDRTWVYFADWIAAGRDAQSLIWRDGWRASA